MPSRQYLPQDVKILYGRAAGRCSLPDCRVDVTLPETASDGIKQIGKIAHIVGHSDKGPRGDAAYPKEKLDTIENTLPGQLKSFRSWRGVLGIVPIGGPWGTVPKLLFEKKHLIPDLRQLILSYLEKET